MDRQDIDALLIGALYGELTPAEEARLTAHLESHPTDRGALDDLKVTRQQFLDSRIFQVQLDPPQAVSALLLQEAHRRAPKAAPVKDEKEGWFARFARNFMAHPAMAAAAMLVLVMGGAGILWMKKGDQFADQEYSQPASGTQRAQYENESAPGAAAPVTTATGAAGSAMVAGVADEEDRAKLDEIAADGNAERREGESGARSRAADSKQVATGRLDVNTDRQPKDLPAENAKKEKASADDFGLDSVRGKAPKGGSTSTARIGAGGGGAPNGDLGFGGESANAVSSAGVAAPAPQADAAPSPPPPAPSTGAKNKVAQDKPAAKVATESKPATKTVSKPTSTAAPKAEPQKDSALITWAKGEHAKAVALANNGDCAAAAKIAVSVSTRASSYYTREMATDRKLKSCQQRIAAEREAEAERSQKARASKRVNADEPMAPSESLK